MSIETKIRLRLRRIRRAREDIAAFSGRPDLQIRYIEAEIELINDLKDLLNGIGLMAQADFPGDLSNLSAAARKLLSAPRATHGPED